MTAFSCYYCIKIHLKTIFPHLGVIYLKNMVTQYWSEGDNTHNEVPGSNIPEEDRQFIRDNIVEAILHSPERIR